MDMIAPTQSSADQSHTYFPSTMSDFQNLSHTMDCEVCAGYGRYNVLQVFQINLEEAALVCPFDECTYPIGKDRTYNSLIKRDAFKVPQDPTKKTSRRSSAASSPSVSPTMSPALPISGVNVHRNKQLNQPYKTLVHEQTVPQCDIPNTATTATMCVSKPAVPTQISPSTTMVPLQMNAEATIPNVAIDTYSEWFDPDVFDSMDSVIKEESMTTFCPRIANNNRLFYPQWKNKEALCWLDVSMCMLVHCRVLNIVLEAQDKSCLIKKLFSAYNMASVIVNEDLSKVVNLETSVGTVAVKTGGGDVQQMKTNIFKVTEASDDTLEDFFDKILYGDEATTPQCEADAPSHTPTPPQAILPENIVSKSETLLEDVREEIWRSIYPKLKCERGENDSPVFALPLILDQAPEIKKYFSIHYTWKMVCCHCSFQHEDRVVRVMPTFPNTPGDFSMLAPCFIRSCFKCGAQRQRMNMVFNILPPVVMVHFVKGLPEVSVSELDFTYRGRIYKVKSIVQYKTRPNHFVSWVRNVEDDTWMECDDMKNSVGCFCHNVPAFAMEQVHIVMWEKQGDVTTVPPTPPRPTAPPPVIIPASDEHNGLSSRPTARVLKSNPVAKPMHPSLKRHLPSVPLSKSPANATPQLKTLSSKGQAKSVPAPERSQTKPTMVLHKSNSMPTIPSTTELHKMILASRSHNASKASMSQTSKQKSDSARESKCRLDRVRERLAAMKGGIPNSRSPSPVPVFSPDMTLNTPLNFQTTTLPNVLKPRATTSYFAAVEPFLANKTQSQPTKQRGKYAGYKLGQWRQASSEASQVKSGSSPEPTQRQSNPRLLLNNSPKKSVSFPADPVVNTPMHLGKRKPTDEASQTPPAKILKVNQRGKAETEMKAKQLTHTGHNSTVSFSSIFPVSLPHSENVKSPARVSQPASTVSGSKQDKHKTYASSASGLELPDIFFD